MKSEKFRWAYIGCGNIAKSTSANIMKGEHQIVTVYGRNFEHSASFARSVGAEACHSVDEAVNRPDVDAVYIATPHTSHVEYTLQSFEYGKPVLCEKPVGVSCADVERIFNSAKQNNIYFAEAMWTWFSDVALTVKEWISDGKIGDLQSMTVNYSFPGLMMNKNSRVRTPETAGGALLDIGIYPITYCYNLFGYPDNILCDGVIKNGIDVKEKVVLTYGKADCTLNMSLSSLKESCTIIGSKGKIILPIFHMASLAKLKSKYGNQVFHGKTDYLTEFDRVADEIRNNKKESTYIPFSSTMNCMKIMDECRRQMNLQYPFE